MRDYPFIRQLTSPLNDEQLRPLDPRCQVVQFDVALTKGELERAAAFMASYPGITLRVYGHDTYRDLRFLSHFPRVQSVQVDIYHLVDISGLEYLRPDLSCLGFGATRKRFSLRPLERFVALDDLWLEGHSKDFEVVGTRSSLRRLSLRSITVPDLSSLRTLVALEKLELKLGGTKDLRALPEIGRLRYFEAWLVRGLADLGPVAVIDSLEHLFLQALARVTLLPSLAPLRRLKRVTLETMRGLTDLRPVAAAPALDELLVIDMRHLQPEAFRPFLGHPTLRTARIGLGSTRKNKAVRELLGLPDVDP